MNKKDLKIGQLYVINTREPVDDYSQYVTVYKNLELVKKKVHFEPPSWNQSNDVLEFEFVPESLSFIMRYLGFYSHGYGRIAGSLYEIVEILKKDKEDEYELGDIVEVNNHANLMPYNGSESCKPLTARQREAKQLKIKLDKKMKEFEEFKQALSKSESEISTMQSRIKKMEEFPSDEAERAHVVMKLIKAKKSDNLTEKDIEEALKS